MIDTDAIVKIAYELSRKGFSHEFGQPEKEVKTEPIWDEVRKFGTRLWLDTGDINVAARLWCLQFEALTTNNTLLNKEVQKGIYDELIGEVAAAIRKAASDIDGKQFLLEVSFVLNAYHGLRLVELFDAHVSVELHTGLGNDVDRTVMYAQRYYQICPERFYVKVPLTPAGFLATRRLSEQKIPVNFTLGFSARQNYLAALFAQPCYVNVFMGRLNSFVADNNLGDGTNVGEKTTLATQRELLKLREAKRTKSLLIGASMRESSHVTHLAGVDVYTIPPKVVADYLEHHTGQVSRRIEEDPPVPLAEDVTFADFNAATLWKVPNAFKDCVEELLKEDSDNLTPDDIQAHFENGGFADLLPRWSDEDIKTAAADGKIPVYDSWKERLESGKIGMDALMNLSAFCSFATDQKALDDRIKSLV